MEGEGCKQGLLFVFPLSVNYWTKVKKSEDTRRGKAAENTNTGDCQAGGDKTFTIGPPVLNTKGIQILKQI